MKIREFFSPARPTHRLNRRNPARQTSLSLERLGDRILFAADFGCDVVESKATPAVISTESTSTSHSSDREDTSSETQEMSTTAGKSKTESVDDFTKAKTEKVKKESAKTNQGSGGSGGFPMSEWEPSQETTSPPTLPTKQRIIGDVSQAVVEPVEEHLPSLKLEEVEGLGRLKENLLEDVMAERTSDTERYGKIERDSLMTEHSNPNRIVGDIHDVDLVQSPTNDVSENTVRSVDGYGMASDGQSKGGFYNFFEFLDNARIPGLSDAAKVTNKIHDWLISIAPLGRYETYQDYLQQSKKDPKNDGTGLKDFIWQPAPDGTGSETPLPTSLVREAVAKLYAQYAQQPWVGTAGQPVPDDDGGTPFDFAAASEVFSQLARQSWNPMIVQPGPDGDMEYNYLGMKEVPRNVGAMKMAMTGQPLPEDPDWGGNDGVEKSGSLLNPQPITTHRSEVASAVPEAGEIPPKGK